MTATSMPPTPSRRSRGPLPAPPAPSGFDAEITEHALSGPPAFPRPEALPAQRPRPHDPARKAPAVSDLVLPNSADRAGGQPPPRPRAPSVRGLGLGPTPAELDRLAKLAGARKSNPPVSLPPQGPPPQELELSNLLDELNRNEPALGSDPHMPFSTPPDTGPSFDQGPSTVKAAPNPVQGLGRSARGQTGGRPSKAAPDWPAKNRPRPPSLGMDRRPTANEIRFDTAPLWRRMVATTIDAGLVAALVILPLRAGWFGPVAQKIRPWEPDDIGRALFEGHLTLPLIVGFVAVFALGSVPHGLAGRTLGKFVTGLMIVNSWTGERPGWPQVLLRQMVGLFTTVLGVASYLWFIVDRRNAALHDRLTGTACVIANSRVVRAARDPVG